MGRRNMTGRSSEAIFWSLFAAGGVLAALLMPITILSIGILGPLEWEWFAKATSFTGIQDLLNFPLIRVITAIVLTLISMHAVHRIRHLIIDMHVPLHPSLVAFIAYTAAFAVAGLIAVSLVLI